MKSKILWKWNNSKFVVVVVFFKHVLLQEILKSPKEKKPCEISRNFLESVSLNNPTELLTNNTSSKNKSNWTFNLEDRQKIFSYLTYYSLWWGLTRSLNLHLDTETLICTNMGFYWLLGIMLYAAQRVLFSKCKKSAKNSWKQFSPNNLHKTCLDFFRDCRFSSIYTAHFFRILDSLCTGNTHTHTQKM